MEARVLMKPILIALGENEKTCLTATYHEIQICAAVLDLWGDKLTES